MNRIDLSSRRVGYSRTVKLLHWLLAAGVGAQLLFSLVMQQPRPGRVRSLLESAFFSTHEVLGLSILALLTLHWLLWLAGRTSRGIGQFYPWFSRTRRAALGVELRALARLRLGEPEAQENLAGAVQGIGIAIASLLAVTGTLLYFGMAPDGSMSAGLRAVREVHKALATGMWTYLGIHAGAALAHVALGHRSVLDIFRLRAAERPERPCESS